MPIHLRCPACKAVVAAPDEAAGRLVRCGGCQATLRVPAPEPPPPPPFEVVPEEPAPPPPRRRVEAVADDEPAHGAYDLDRESDEDRYDDRPPRRRPRRRRPAPRPAGRGPLFWVLMVFLGLTLVGVSCCGGLLWVARPQWRTYESAAGGFKCELPAAPRTDMARIAGVPNDPDVKIEGTILWGKLEEYSVVYAEIDPGKRQTTTDEALIDEAVTEAINDTPGTRKESERAVTVSGFPGKEVVFYHPDDGRALMRVVVADTRIYIVVAGGRFASADEPRVRRFINSFEITDPRLLAVPRRRAWQR
jgi:hypothetical protein